MDQTFEPAHSSKRSEKKSSRSTRPTTASALGFDLGAIDDEGQANKLSLADFGDVDLATLDYNLEVLGGGRERKKEKKKTPDEKSKRVKKEKHRDRKPRAVVPQADLSGLASKTRTSEDYLAEWAQHSPEQNVALFERGLQVTQADKGYIITRFTPKLGTRKTLTPGPELGARMYAQYREWVAKGRGFDPETPTQTQASQQEGLQAAMGSVGLVSGGSEVVGPSAALLTQLIQTLPPDAVAKNPQLAMIVLGTPADIKGLPHSDYTKEVLTLRESALAQPKDQFLQLATHELGHAFLENRARNLPGDQVKALAAAHATIHQHGAYFGVDGGMLGDPEDRIVYQASNGSETRKKKKTTTTTVEEPEKEKKAGAHTHGSGGKKAHPLEGASEFLAETFMSYSLHQASLLEFVSRLEGEPAAAWKLVLDTMRALAGSGEGSNALMDQHRPKKV